MTEQQPRSRRHRRGPQHYPEGDGSGGGSGSSSPPPPGGEGAAASSVDVAALVRRVRLLEAQNAALRSATADAAATVAVAAAPPTRSLAAPAPPGIPGAPAAGGSGWTDAERKLRKRVETLTAKLTEAAKDAEAARAGEAAASTALARLKGERDALDKRLAAVSRKQAALDAATASALEHLAPVAQVGSRMEGEDAVPEFPHTTPPSLSAQLRERIFELEGALAAVRARAEGEMPAEVARAQAEARTAEGRAAAAEADAADARERLAQLQVGGHAHEASHRSRHPAPALLPPPLPLQRRVNAAWPQQHQQQQHPISEDGALALAEDK